MSPEPKVKFSIYLPAERLKRLDQHLMKTVGYIKGPRSAFVVMAIKEKLDREEKKK